MKNDLISRSETKKLLNEYIYPSDKNDKCNEGLRLAISVIDEMQSPEICPCDVCNYNPPFVNNDKPCFHCPALWKDE